VCFNLLSDNESNTIRVIWYFVNVMLYNFSCIISTLTGCIAIDILSYLFLSDIM